MGVLSVLSVSVHVCEYITSVAFGSCQLEWRNSSDHTCLPVVVLCVSTVGIYVNFGKGVVFCMCSSALAVRVSVCVCVSLLEMCSSSLLARLGTQSHSNLASLGLGQEEFPWILKPTTTWLPLTYTYRIFSRRRRIHSAFGKHELIFLLCL